MKERYIVTKTLYAGRNSSRVAYGIALVGENIGDVLDQYCDLTSNRAEICRLVDACNRMEVLPEHFGDVVEDFISK